MSEQIVAYCGLVCTECPALIATQDGDTEKLKALALEWYGQEGDASFCRCTGCTTPGLKNKHCLACEVRLCATERGVLNCAHCNDYGCDTLNGLFKFIPLAKENLERIRATLI
jgi:hypothetical protein